MEKVSIIVPTYKRNRIYLARAIESLLNQTYKNIEIIVVDDNQKDSVYRKDVEKYMNEFSKNSKIIYLKNETNLGGSKARNEGINISKGRFITFLDDDDEYLPFKIENQVSFMENNNYDLTFANMKMLNQKGHIVDFREFNDLKEFDNESLFTYHLMRHITGTPTFMFKADILKKIGGFENALVGQEFYLMLKSIDNNLNIGHLNKCDVLVYKHRDGGIAQGENKIIGEQKLYDFKKSQFSKFTNRQKRFIRFRHYAVMVVAYLRNSQYLKALGTLIISLIVSPIDFFNEGFIFLKKIFEKNISKSGGK